MKSPSCIGLPLFCVWLTLLTGVGCTAAVPSPDGSGTGPGLEASLDARSRPDERTALLRVLRDEFAALDGAGGRIQDGVIEDAELLHVSGDMALPRALREAAARLRQDAADLLRELDSAGPGGIPDGRFGRGVVNAALGIDWASPLPTTEPATFRLACWNVENFFDTFDDPERSDERVGGGIPSAAELDDKVRRLAHVLEAARADIIALQEVETREVLDVLAKAVAPDGSIPPAHRVLVDSGTFEGRSLALLSRFPVTRVVGHSRVPLALPAIAAPLAHWKHHLLEVEVNIEGKGVVFLIVHQAARQDGEWGKQTEAFRLSEASYTRQVADALRSQYPHRPVVVLGDFNDEPHDASVRTFTADGALTDVLASIPAEYRWTSLYRPAPGVTIRRVIDGILVSPDLAASATNPYVHHAPDAHLASDHRAMSVTLTW